MCGINGIISAGRTPLEQLCAAIEGMNAVLAHRGPDGHGRWVSANGSVAFGHRRLSIIDLTETAAQPMVSDDQLVAMTFNGEVYNFADIRSELRQHGYTFCSHGDSEVVLKAFHCWGVQAFEKFNGMFAIAFFDARINRVFLVRDRLGVKPLHYTRNGEHVVFSSEIKGIAASGMAEIVPAYGALHEFLYFGNTLGGFTLFKDIQRVLPGHYVIIDPATLAMTDHCYWSASSIPEIAVKESDAIAGIRDRLEAAVARQLVSDVPVGLLLSGGLDSTGILAFAARHSQHKLTTYTAGFDHIVDVDEAPLARKTAALFESNHEEVRISGDDLVPLLKRLVAAHDMPFSDAANIPLVQLYEKLRGKIKVVLQGDGGDEVFGGYNRYELLSWMQNVGAYGFNSVGLPIGRMINRLLFGFGVAPRRRRLLNALVQQEPALRMALLLTVEDSRDEPISVLGGDIRELAARSDPFVRYRQIADQLSERCPPQQMLLTDLQIILPDIFLEKVDRSAMAASIEVRVPFLDHDLVDYVASLPSQTKLGRGHKKHLLRKALRGIVPDSVVDAPKMGFGTPFSHWIKGQLADIVLEAAETRSGGAAALLFDPAVIRERVRAHREGERDFGFLLWKCLQLTLWHDYVGELRQRSRRAANPAAAKSLA